MKSANVEIYNVKKVRSRKKLQEKQQKCLWGNKLLMRSGKRIEYVVWVMVSNSSLIHLLSRYAKMHAGFSSSEISLVD